MQKYALACTVFLLCAVISAIYPAHAQDGETVFATRCGSCHKSGGEAPAFAPAKFAAIQWERFFSRNKHAKFKDITTQFSAADLNDVKIFLIAHAADSDRPQAVGLK